MGSKVEEKSRSNNDVRPGGLKSGGKKKPSWQFRGLFAYVLRAATVKGDWEKISLGNFRVLPLAQRPLAPTVHKIVLLTLTTFGKVPSFMTSVLIPCARRTYSLDHGRSSGT